MRCLQPGCIVPCIRWPEHALQSDTLMQAAQDYRTDPYLHKACQADVDKRCKGIKPEKGLVQECLVLSIRLLCA